MESKLTVAYWAIRGLGQNVRTLLEYLGQTFEDQMYLQNQAEEWFGKDQPQLQKRNPFITLPYLIDGDLVITQSQAVLIHICLKFKPELLGTSNDQKVEYQTIKGCLKDLNTNLVRHYYDKANIEKTKQNVIQNQTVPHLKQLSAHLGTKQFIGGKITLNDFKMFETLSNLDTYDSTVLKAFPNLVQHLARFKELPKIKEYFASSRFSARPINGNDAGFK